MLRFFLVGLIAFPIALSPAVAANAPGAKAAEEAGPPIVFMTDLSSYEESAVTDSPAVGHLECALEPATLKFTWKMTYRDLTSPITSAAFHGPQGPGGEAGVMIAIPPTAFKSPMEGSVILTESQLESLLHGRVYMNVKTVKFPTGEIRGQLRRQRPKPPNT